MSSNNASASSKSLRVAVVGATGAVGREMVKVLHDRNFPVAELGLFASERSAGKVQETPYGALTLQAFDAAVVKGYDVVLLAVSGDFAKAHAKDLASAGALVIDNSSAFRYDADIPLIVPEINAHVFREAYAARARLIAIPNCTTAIAVVALLLCGYVGRGKGALYAGSVFQALVIASGVLMSAMYVLGGIFAALWFTGIWLGRKWERDGVKTKTA